MSYRGPNNRRMGGQFSALIGWNGEACTWRQWNSASTAAGSGLYAGGGVTQHYLERTITALWAAPQGGESRFRETQLPGGMEVGGDAILSTQLPLGARDEVDWRGTTYRIEGDSVPVHIGGRLWYRTVLRRGDATG